LLSPFAEAVVPWKGDPVCGFVENRLKSPTNFAEEVELLAARRMLRIRALERNDGKVHGQIADSSQREKFEATLDFRTAAERLATLRDDKPNQI